ncbi:MAG: hypothetical protein AB7W16_13835 [Candidatus Obscuribacterales bacterium]
MADTQPEVPSRKTQDVSQPQPHQEGQYFGLGSSSLGDLWTLNGGGQGNAGNKRRTAGEQAAAGDDNHAGPTIKDGPDGSKIICEGDMCRVVPAGALDQTGQQGLPDGGNLLRQILGGDGQGLSPGGLLRRHQPFKPSRAGELPGGGPVISRIQELMRNPAVQNGITDLMGRSGINIDPERKEISLSMDFASMYDKLSALNPESADPNPETRRFLAGLDRLTLSADQLKLKFKSEQTMSLGDQGFARGYSVAMGTENGETSFNLATTPTRLTLDGIKGMQSVDAQGNRLDIHKLVLDTSDPKNPTGSLTIDNPLKKPAFLPAATTWPEQVTLPMRLPVEEQQSLASTLPGAIKALDGLRTAAKTGDMTALAAGLSGDGTAASGSLSDLMNWTMRNRGQFDLETRNPMMYDGIKGKLPQPRRNNTDPFFMPPRPGGERPRLRY